MMMSRFFLPGGNQGKVERRLVAWLCLLLVVLVGLLLGSFSFFGQQNRNEMTGNLVRQAAGEASRRFQQQIERSHRLLETLSGWGTEGLLLEPNVENLRQKLLPLVDNLPTIAGLSLADDAGRDFFMARDQGGWLVRSSKHSDAYSHWQFWKEGQLEREWNAADRFDPRQRVWYRPARQNPGAVFWTGLYRFHTLNRLGVSASLSWKSNKSVQVAAVDLLIDDLVAALQVPELGADGMAFTVAADGALNDVSPGPAKEERRQLLDAYQKVRRPGDAVLSFKALGKTWYAGEELISLETGQVRIGILVPESEIDPGLSGDRRQFLLVVAAILAIAILALLLLLNRFKRHFVPAVSRPDATWLQAVISGGENARVEFKSTMRANLKTGKPGKEIEMAWLKGVVGFLNTAGGTLLLGVNDDGQIVGLEADAFQNEDKCRLHFKNLVSEHIGLEYSRCLHFDLVEQDGLQVAVVQCDRSAEPVFLRQGKEENFYIRSGPASVRLTGRQMLQYLSGKKGRGEHRFESR